MTQKTNMTLLLFLAIIIIGSIGVAISGVHYNPLYLTENESNTRIEYNNVTGVLYITNNGNVSITNNERTAYQTLKAGDILSDDVLVCLADGTNCQANNVTFNGGNITATSVNSSGSVWSGSQNLANSAAGWTNTTTTTNTMLKVGINTTDLVASTTFLQVGDNSSGDKYLSFRTDNAANRGIMYYLLAGTLRGYVYWDTEEDLLLRGDSIRFMTNTAEIMRLVEATQLVGIGITTPSQKLSVLGNSNVSNVSYQPQNVLTSGFSGLGLLGVSGAVLVPNKTTVYNGVRQGGQNGAVFNGSQYIQQTSVVLYNNNSRDLTISVWFYPNNNNQWVFSRISTETGDGLRVVYASDNKLKMYWENITGTLRSVDSSNTMPVNSLIHAVVLANSTNIWTYYNGTASSVTSANYLSVANGLYLGKMYAGGNFNGSIYKASVWNRTLSAVEVGVEFGLGPNTPTNNTNGLVLQYLLNKTPDVMATYSNSSHVKDVAYISTGEYYHQFFDVSGVPIHTVVWT